MKRLTKTLTLLLAGGLIVSSVAVAGDVEVSGQVRVRGELDKKSFVEDSHAQQYTEMRTRVNLATSVNENAHIFIQFQDSRRWGDPSSGLNLDDRQNVDLHQAYMKYDRVFWDGFGIKAGRFELNLGNQRVFGSVGWSNTARSWEGGNAWYKNENFKLTGIGLKAMEMNDTGYDRDYNVYGLIFDLYEANLQAFIVHEADLDTNGLDAGIDMLKRTSLGLYYHRTHNQFDFNTNFVYQMGNMPMTASTEYDIKAYLLTFEAGYALQDARNTRLAVGIDLASGDDDTTDDEFKAYNNLFYTGHKFRGHMDYFGSSNIEGLMDIMFRAKSELFPEWVFKVDLHKFSTAQDFASAVDGSDTKSLGFEIDLSVHTTKIAGSKNSVGVSFFSPSEDAAGADAESGFWLYGQTVVNF